MKLGHEIVLALQNTANRIKNIAENNPNKRALLDIIYKMLHGKNPPTDEVAKLFTFCEAIIDKESKTQIEIEACYLLALCALEGLACDRNISYATEIFKKIIKYHPHASYYLGCISIGLSGDKSNQNLSLAHQYFFNGRSSWDGWMLYTIGLYFQKDNNPAAAFEYFERGANCGHIEAIVRLADCHRFGLGTVVNPQKALAIYKSVAFNNAQAMGRAAELLLEIPAGSNEEKIKNERMAMDYYLYAAQNNDMIAFYNLAEGYELGRGGMPVDFLKAANYYLHILQYQSEARVYAINACHRLAMAWKDKKDIDNKPAKNDLSNAVKLFTRLTQIKHLPSQFQLALLYFQGQGVEQDREKAKEYLKTLPENEFPQAKQYLMACDTAPAPIAPTAAMPILQMLENRSTFNTASYPAFAFSTASTTITASAASSVYSCSSSSSASPSASTTKSPAMPDKMMVESTTIVQNLHKKLGPQAIADKTLFKDITNTAACNHFMAHYSAQFDSRGIKIQRPETPNPTQNQSESSIGMKSEQQPVVKVRKNLFQTK